MTTNNAINANVAGLVRYNGTGIFDSVTTINHDVLIGSSNNGITNVGPSATSGVPLISQGSSSDPLFGTAVVAGGGTGAVTLTNHGVLLGQGTSAITSTATGSSGQVLRSGGTSSDPSYSTATYPNTAGTSGNVLTSDGTNWISSASASGTATLNYVTLTLTSSQVKALHGTPIQLIAAPGAGKVIAIVSNVWSKLTYGGTSVFTAGASQTIVLSYGTTQTIGTPMSNVGITGSATAYSNGTLAPAFSNVSAASLENIAVSLYNPVATEITGNAANNNTIGVGVVYYIITL